MTRFLAAVIALTLAAPAFAGPPCSGVKVQSAQTYVAPAAYHAPAYVAPAAVSYAQVQYVYQPIATVVVPGNPVAVLNVYPGTTVLVQQAPPVNVTVTIDGKTGQAQVEQKK